MLPVPTTVLAGSATWKKNPSSGDWNTATNWTAGGPPNGPSDTATFALSDTTGVSLSANTEVNGIVFNAGASAFTITASPTVTLTISGVGITNNSGITQNFVAAEDGSGTGVISFRNSATAGSGTVFTNNPGTVSGHAGGIIGFSDSSTAGNGTFTNKSGVVGGGRSGSITFLLTSNAGNGTFTNEGNGRAIDPNINAGGDIRFSTAATAGNGIFTNNGGASSGAIGGTVLFIDNSSAGHAILTNNGGMVSGAVGGSIVFGNQSTAANATLIMNGGVNGGAGGTLQFFSGARGGKARVAFYGNGNLDLTVPQGLIPMPLTIGSIEGSGQVFLGGNTLTVGTNNLSTIFSGMIQDGGKYGGTGGHLTKVGTGTLTLANPNTYTGVTTINGGTLLVSNKHGSGTGSNSVAVNAGTLGGTGAIAGAVFLGSGSGPGAFLSPGKGGAGLGTLTIRSDLFFAGSDATYEVELNSSTAKADKVGAKGVTINSGAQFSFADLGSGTLTQGTVFTVIKNTAALPISGTFSNLPDGSTFTNNGNSYQVNYEGGDGNDLTLTVQ